MQLRLVAILLLLLKGAFAHGVEITVGDTTIEIPTPEGFAVVTDEMQPFAEAIKHFVPPINVQFAYFVPAELAPELASGAMPEFQRQCYVQTTKDLVSKFVTTAEFARLKQAVKSQNAKLMKDAEAKIPGMMDKINRDLSHDFGVDLDLSLAEMIPLPPHDEQERRMSYSMYVAHKLNDEQGQPTTVHSVVTATYLHVKGKLLFLYATGGNSELEWSRNAARTWTEAVQAANPSDPAIAAREQAPLKWGFDLQHIRNSALLGAAIGGIAGGMAAACGVFLKKRKPPESGPS